MLSFHRVREAISAGIINIINVTFIDGRNNPADVLSKHWAYPKVQTFLKAMLFWKGDTINIE